MSIAGTYADEATKFAGHLLATGSANNTAALDFTINLSTYSTYVFELWNIVPVDNAGHHFLMFVSGDGGATWQSVSYWWQVSETYSHQAPAYWGSVGAGSGPNVIPLGNQAAQSLSGRVIFWSDPARSACRQFLWHMSGYNMTGAASCGYGSGMCANIGVINAVRFGFNVNMAFGTIRLYGLAK